MSEELNQLRVRIDQLDEQIQELLTERAKIALQVAASKIKSQDTNFYRAEREAQVLRRVKERNKGPLSDEEIARLFREIISACLALEQVMTIAFLGPEGTFTQAAALKHFGHSVATLPLATIGDVFREVESGNVSYGVVPVENSTEGVVSHTLDQFMNSPLHICGEVELRIHHHLLGKGKDTKNISRIYSHRQSLAQCREWLETNMPGIELRDVNSNAEAARLAAQEENALAIASETAAEIYGLNVLVRNIEDEPDNTTRFLVIGKRATPPSGKDKTSLLISTQNKPGSLYRVLEPLVKHKISMTRIESRPSRRGMWDYVFFIDCEGHREDERVAAALSELEHEVSFLKILGSYPRSVL
ncbi:MAG: prephenate dehydratase [Gammaproteobacteria bacterium]|nr:prephenate dehydratase [Gammaproteobacteria bacterium]